MAVKKPRTKFVTLLDLLRKRITPATLATAIEKHGICGWDRFGRFKRFSAQDPESNQVLDALAAQRAWNCGQMPEEERSPAEAAEAFPGDGGALYLGWRKNELPAFKETAATAAERRDPPPPVRAGAGGRGKGERFDLALIGALLEYISGALTPQAHPHWQNASKLAELIDDKYAGKAGTASSLRKKFGEANDKLDEVLR